MKSNGLFWVELIVSFFPFVLFALLNNKANVKKDYRNRQYVMPVVAVVYSLLLSIFLDRLSRVCLQLFLSLANMLEKINLSAAANFMRNIYTSWGVYFALVLFNTMALLIYVAIKRVLTAILGKLPVRRNTWIASFIEVFYSYDELDGQWYIKEHFGQARAFIKTAYYGSCAVSGLALLISCGLCMNNLIAAPFYPVFAIIIIGEMAFFIDGVEKSDRKSELSVQADNSRHIVMYPLLRKPLKELFHDKLSVEGTTMNNGGATGGAIEDILVSLEKTGGHVGRNYSAFIRKKMEAGLKPNADYVRCGYDLSVGKSLLFNTPFYDKLNPYVFYSMNRELLIGGKILIVLGRHGIEDDLQQWLKGGMKEVSNVPELWKIAVLTSGKLDEEKSPDIGIISRSGVHDLDMHKNNQLFLQKVSFVVVIEPSKLVTTAQIGLNLLVKCCGKERPITFCSVDRNCDGLVDALSHILMTNIIEVSATEYPHGMSSYMHWIADDEYLQHRILPGVSRFLGMGTELSAVALKNQVKKTIWYGGDAFPVLDAHWIAKQYYYDLLEYAQLLTNQETFDTHFQASYNMCNERVSEYSFITVEDERNNLSETRRNFATIAEQQGFVNVISSEYMLREYMSDNMEIFIADPKAIPYITADYARTRRNAVLSLCLLLCINSVKEEIVLRQLKILNIDTKDPVSAIWQEICAVFGNGTTDDRQNGRIATFDRDSTILFKREYCVESGKFENVYTIENAAFSNIILEDLQSASYIAEQDSKDVYIGTELKGHVYQKYMPGQFFTLNGKYYEMISTDSDNRILVRRASEHIDGRLSYRQVRNYKISHLEDSSSMGSLKTINNIDIHYQFADFSVDTPGYWKMGARNDFDHGVLVNVNGVPTREYYHKQVLKFDFSRFGDTFTDSVRMTLTNLLNEVFVTLFAENQAFISAVTLGHYEAPLTYSLEFGEEFEKADKCIFIIEDSQLDIGLLIAVERNVNRIFQIVTDYLAWNAEKIAESLRKQNEPAEEKEVTAFDVYSEDEAIEKKKSIFGRIVDWFKKLLKRNLVEENSEEISDETSDDEERKKSEKAKKRAEKRAEKATKKAEKRAEREAAKEKKKKEKKKTSEQIEKTGEEVNEDE